MELIDKLINILVALILGAFGALARLIHSKPYTLTFIIIISELIIGAFVGWMIYIILINFSTFDFAVISIYCAIGGVVSRELLGVLISVVSKELKNKYNIDVERRK